MKECVRSGVGGNTNLELGMRNLTNELGVRFEVGGKKTNQFNLKRSCSIGRIRDKGKKGTLQSVHGDGNHF